MLIAAVAACFNGTHFPAFAPVNQTCIVCEEATQIPVQFACGCPGTQTFTAAGTFACTAGCTANQQFAGVTVCPTESNHETTCGAGLASGFRGNQMYCGHLRYSPEANEDVAQDVTLCAAGSTWIPEFQVCWPAAGVINITDVARSLCDLNFTVNDSSAIYNGRACQYLMNACADDLLICNRSDLYRSVNYTDGMYLPYVKDYKYKPFNDSAPKTRGNENYANITFTLSRRSGQILMKSKLFYESLDFCSITEAGLNPLFQRLHRFHQADQKDRTWNIGLLTRYLLHRKSEMIRRNSDEYINLMGGSDFKYGQKFRKQCRIGHAVLQRFLREYGDEPLYVTFYVGDYSTTQVADGQRTSERIVPVRYREQNYLSFPLWRVDSGDASFVSKIQFVFLSDQALVEQHPIIYFDTIDVPRLAAAPNVTESPILNRIITKLTNIGRGRLNYGDEVNYVDFDYSIAFENINFVRGLATRSAIVLVIVWFAYALYGISQTRKLLGLNSSFQNASARVISYLLTVMCLGVGSAFLLDLALQGILRVASPISFLADGYESRRLVESSVLVGSVMFIVIELAQQLYSVPTLRFVVFDHGDPAYYYRRFFVGNCLNKLLKERLFPLYLPYCASMVLLYAFDVFYADGTLSYASLTPHFSESFSRVSVFALVLLVCHVASAVLAQAWRFFQRATVYDRFVDVLPLCGCSVLVFDSPYSAFFVYGAPIYGDCDASGAAFTRNLLNEAQSLTPRRGLNGKSAQSFRIYFSAQCTELSALYAAAQEISEFQPAVPANCGEVALPNAQQITNARFSAKIPAFGPEVPQKIAEQQKLMPAAMQLIQAQPVRYTAKPARIFDFNFAALTSPILVVSDPTRNFSPHASDTGNMLPGGLGGPAWISKAFWYSHWWLDALFGVAITCIIGYVTGNLAAGLVVSWALTEAWSRACMLGMRKSLGMGAGCCEGIMM